jgi:uncharacterized protein YbjT (DUF2867 family)
MKVFVTGATGNVGQEVIKFLSLNKNIQIKAGVRDLQKAERILSQSKCDLVKFDFKNPDSFDKAIREGEVLFLLRPPEISEVKSTIKPLIKISKWHGIKHIIFLSVQGVEDQTFIPHYKIEQFIIESKIPYTFLRPAYFMQNFTTTLRYELQQNRRIFLPAGNTNFSLIDIRDIGSVTAHILQNLSLHEFKSYPLTSAEKLNFEEMADIITTETGITIDYQSPDLLKFIWVKRHQNMPLKMILVMIMLHYFPRFKKEPKISSCVKDITDKRPISFKEFVSKYKDEMI